MTDWKRLHDDNPEPSILDAIAFASFDTSKTEVAVPRPFPKARRFGQKLKELAVYIDTFGLGETK